MQKATEPAGGKIRVLIADDHAIVRQGLRTFLEIQDDPTKLPIEVVGEAANGIDAIELARRTQPDILLLDLVMPEMDGIRAIPRIVECSPDSRIIILTSFGEEDKVIPAIQAGAQGYLLKDISPDRLVQAIRNAYRGEVQLHPNAAQQLMSAITQRENAAALPSSQSVLEELTERECDVLRLIARGMSNHKMAETLFISEKTVKTHVSNILNKLHLEDRTQAAIYAWKHGFARDED